MRRASCPVVTHLLLLLVVIVTEVLCLRRHVDMLLIRTMTSRHDQDARHGHARPPARTHAGRDREKTDYKRQISAEAPATNRQASGKR